MDENDPIYQAIDAGGGQTCDIAGVVRELKAAGYVIVQRSILEGALEAAESYQDEGPPGEGWRSDSLESACKTIRTALKAD